MNNETEQIFLVNTGANPAAAAAQKGDAIAGTTQVNLEDVQDFSTVCRTCATITEFVIPIFEGEGLQNNLADKIQKHLPIQVLENDPLPRVVCYQCASTLLAWHELVKCCVQADEALKARLAQLQRTPSTVLLESEWSSSKNDQNKEQEPKTEPTEATIKREESPFSQEDKRVIVEEDRRHVTCPICQKQVIKGSWRRHERCHNGEKRYRCDACGLGFSDGGNLARHARALHAQHRPFKCTTCNQTFSRNSHLQDHIKSKHSATRDFVCDVCGKASKSKAALRMHKRTHDSELRVRCMECGAGFKRRGELRAHVSVHTGERAHVCACGKAFRLRAQLTRHKRRQHHAETTRDHTQRTALSGEKERSPPRYVDACISARPGEPPPACAGETPLACAGEPPPTCAGEPPLACAGEPPQACPYCRLSLPARVYKDHLVDAHAELLFHCQECDTYVDRKDFILHMSFHCVQYSKATAEAKDKAKTEPKRTKLRKKQVKDENAKPKKEIPIGYTKRERILVETKADTVESSKEIKSVGDAEANDFSDHSDGDYGFGPLPESVFDAIEDSQDNAPRDPTAPDNQTGTQPKVNTDKQKPEANGKVASHKKPRTCPICSKTYNASSSYFYHMKYFHRQSKEHACEVCGRKFGTRGSLAQHASIHTGERRLECTRCGKRFRSKASLYIHSQTHTAGAGSACAECGRVFRWRAALARHAARHAPARAHACGCGRAFAVRGDLLRHTRTHSQGHYACQHCTATFAQPRYLRVHLLKKHGISKDNSVKETSAVETDSPTVKTG